MKEYLSDISERVFRSKAIGEERLKHNLFKGEGNFSKRIK